ncbi:MAG TPA: hypothetical protein VMT53_10625 [Terriglobales bacterium]|nr:hypothetical protein [Terriglobales bacterium]
MNQDEKRTAGEKKSPKPKKTYRKPEFRYERVFETMALACGKINPTQASCHSFRKRS